MEKGNSFNKKIYMLSIYEQGRRPVGMYSALGQEIRATHFAGLMHSRRIYKENDKMSN